MVNYDIIKNPELRLLVAASESIHSLDETEIQQWVERIAVLPPEGEMQMLTALRDEQKQISEAKLAKGITPEMDLAQTQENLKQVTAIKKDFDMVVLKENERVSKQESEIAATNLLNNI